MLSTKPYLIRAIHEWCSDQGYTPYLSVRVDAATRVPREYVKDGEIVLNVGGEATHQLSLGNEEITFQARFGGRSFPVVVPVDRVVAIYARENGDGMAFELVEPDDEPAAAELAPDDDGTAPADAQPPQRAPGKPFLTRVK